MRQELQDFQTARQQQQILFTAVESNHGSEHESRGSGKGTGRHDPDCNAACSKCKRIESCDIIARTSHLSRTVTQTEFFETVAKVKESKLGADFTINTMRLQA